eukprot:51225_1
MSLSSEELRSRLLRRLRKSGFLDSLKAQLRSELLNQLKNPQESALPKHTSLRTRALNSLLIDYLETRSYSYSTSVFVAESGVEREFDDAEMLQVLELGNCRLMEGGEDNITKESQTALEKIIRTLAKLSKLPINKRAPDSGQHKLEAG